MLPDWPVAYGCAAPVQVVQLSLLAKHLTRSTVVNVHGVSAKFLQAGEKKAALLRWQQQQQALEVRQQEQQQHAVKRQEQRQPEVTQQQQQQQRPELVPATSQASISCFSKVSKATACALRCLQALVLLGMSAMHVVTGQQSCCACLAAALPGPAAAGPASAAHQRADGLSYVFLA